MSIRYIQRLRAVRGEFEAARQGIAFVRQNWQRYDIYQDMTGITPANFQRTGKYLFATYLLRLTAEFEGILKYHLTFYYPHVSIPKDVKVDWLTSKASKLEGFKIDPNLRTHMEKVRKYRNDFVHSGQLPISDFTFDAALSWFSTFLAKLPDPLN